MRFRVVVKVLQYLLLTVGVSACGALAGGLAVWPLMPLSRHDGWGLEVFIVIGGGLLGAIAGFVWITFWILRHDSETWSPATWTGVFLGLFLGLVSGWTLFHLGIPSRLFRQTAHFEIVLIPLVSAACATLGGTAGNFVGFRRRDLKDTRHDSKDIF